MPHLNRTWSHLVGPLLSLATLQGCGGKLADLYKNPDKKCKQDCGASQDVATYPRQTPPLSFDWSSWDGHTSRSRVSNDNLAALIGSNPFALLGSALKATQEEILAVAQKKSSINPSDSCLVASFSTPIQRHATGYTASVDWGKCLDLSALSQSNATTGQSLSVTDLESGFSVRVAIASGASSGVSPENAFDLPKALPLIPFPKSSTLRLLFSRVQSKTLLAQEGGRQAKERSWAYWGMGISSSEPLEVQVSPTGSLTWMGSFPFIMGKTANPSSQEDWVGSGAAGLSGEYLFDATTTNSLSDTAWTVDALGTPLSTLQITGHYYLRVNGDMFEMEGQGGCEVTVSQTYLNGQLLNPKETIGKVSLCKSNALHLMGENPFSPLISP